MQFARNSANMVAPDRKTKILGLILHSSQVSKSVLHLTQRSIPKREIFTLVSLQYRRLFRFSFSLIYRSKRGSRSVCMRKTVSLVKWAPFVVSICKCQLSTTSPSLSRLRALPSNGGTKLASSNFRPRTIRSQTSLQIEPYMIIAVT